MKKLIPTIALSLAVLAPAIQAQTFPDKPVRIIVPYSTGGTTDFTARQVAERLTRMWGTAVVVENKSGADGTIGTDALARSAPDGYTIGFVASQHAASPALYPKLPYALGDFKALTIATQSRMGLLTRADFPANSVAELVSLAKARPGHLTAAIGGSASVNNQWLKMFEKASGTSFLAVPFRNSGPGHLELLGGRIDVMFDVPSVVLAHIKAGKMKLLAVGGTGKSASTPDTPTLADSSYAIGKSMLTWSAFLVPANTPPAIAAKISQDIIAALKQPEVQRRLADIGLEVVASTPAEADRFIGAEAQRLAQLIRENNITTE